MPFRILEITKPSEVHINFGQLEITQEDFPKTMFLL